MNEVAVSMFIVLLGYADNGANASRAQHLALAYPHIQAAGKEFWETEWFSAGAEDATMTNGLVIANTICQALTVANMNAWRYWWFTGVERHSPLLDKLK